ncbi:hypothetical protein C8F04DRAFT_169961 [Mycena alexandri]|uniref:Uncharacterized protein n=1 Tax=Mycena alexandri TaxID=1745969 RepID=A0AAD6TBW6_9AGAR|nr:hypothetical protein C8F04DRAFT_169961 [Mycena alexandri]
MFFHHRKNIIASWLGYPLQCFRGRTRQAAPPRNLLGTASLGIREAQQQTAGGVNIWTSHISWRGTASPALNDHLPTTTKPPPSMDDAPCFDSQFTWDTTTDDSQSAPYAGAFFPNSKNFVVAGGRFTSNTTHIHHATILPILPSDFRMIPLGDIDLQKEIHLNEISGTVSRQRAAGTVRRLYSAKIEGKNSNMTVALYQGENAEDVC